MNLNLPVMTNDADLAMIVFFLGVAFLACLVVIHVAFAIGIWADSQTLPPKDARALRSARQTTLFPVWVWTLATLLLGIPVVATYWAIHRSTLRPPAPSA